MIDCWTKLPEERPSFTDVVSTVSNYAELVAGYLDISCYNPFESMYTSIGSDTGATGSSGNYRDTIASSASTEQLVHNGSNINLEDRDKKKQRVLSISSACASPQASSPTLKFSEPSTPSSAGIEIRI
jgi:hypothetical protein